MTSDRRPVVAIVGRPNVGKSTLFNRVVGSRRAIVDDVPGVTRDRIYADGEWEGKAFTAVDTGGFLADTDDRLLQRVRDQATQAIAEADVLVLVTDGTAGLTAADEEMARLLRRSGKPLVLALNKLDSTRREQEEAYTELYRLGIERTFPVSAEHGRGVGELMDAVAALLPAWVEPEAGEDDDLVRVAVVGRPNVGKSTFINRLLGEDRLVASELPGTTTDPVDTPLTHRGRRYLLTDTAGIRRKSVIEAKVEQSSVMHALTSIDRAHVVVALLDAREVAVEQDARIASVALEKGRALVLFVNKWDLVPEPEKQKEIREEVLIRLPFARWVPVLYGSALTGAHVHAALDRAALASDKHRSRVPTPLLNDFMQKIGDEHPAPLSSGGRSVRLYYAAQVGVRPPTFAISCNRPEAVTDDYRRFVVNRMREAFGLDVPIRLLLRKRSSRR